jgi:predicted metalloprotease with PDZ domain
MGAERNFIERLTAASFRWIVVTAVMAATLTSLASFHAAAQSEYMRGDRMPYDAFDKLPKTDLEISGGTIHVAFAPGNIALPREKIFDWIKASARAVSTYYGRFPVSSLRLLIVPVDGARVRGGTTWGYRGAAIRLPFGRDSSEDDLRRDWVIVHEMVHTALPDLDDRYAWLSEGLAVYVEPVARVQAGDLTAQEIWQAMMRDMPKGLPQAGDEGLDNTDTWGRKYWGGAMFCLLADIEIRKRTGNKFGLQDAVRGVIAAGGNHEQDWSIERVLSTADKAIGVDVLTHLHNEMGPKPVTPDLAALWRDLGLKMQGESLAFDDTAPLAAIRKSITEARPK